MVVQVVVSGMLAGEGCRKVPIKEKGEWQCGLVQVGVSFHVGWGGLQKGIHQRERRVAVWVGAGCYFWHVGWGGVQKGINQRERRM
jgi:hypothetical protein